MKKGPRPAYLSSVILLPSSFLFIPPSAPGAYNGADGIGTPATPDRAGPPQFPMSSQLDILALEPFYGGIRRSMLETVVRLSRHRWTLLKLPPRRIERRLTTAANWFSEQLS